MKQLSNTKSKLVATLDKPYGIINSEIWFLPLDNKATGNKWGDVIAELDDGYLYVPNKTMPMSSVAYIPKGKVQQ